jgi:multiple sugar transport system substrate-binding protein
MPNITLIPILKQVGGETVKKHKLLKGVALGLTLAMTLGLVAGCGTAAPQTTASAKPFAGTQLRVVFANHPWAEAIKAQLPEFEQKTGIKVNLENFFEDQLTTKLTVELTSGTTTIDAMMFRPLQEGKLFAKNGWLNDLSASSQKDKSWDISDFNKGAIGTVTMDKKLYGVPIVTEREILYYRKDILKEKNIAVPKTLDELLAAAKKVTDPSKKLYGFVARGQLSPSVTQFSSFLYSMGGDFAKDGKATLNTPEAIKAYQTYGDLQRLYGPPGTLSMAWPQAFAVFQQGQAAFLTDADSLYTNLTDPKKSTVSDKVGFAPFPAGTAGSKPYNITSWALGLNAKSKNQDATWEFIKWATSKEEALKMQQAGNPGARESVWNNPEGLKNFPAEYAATVKESMKTSVDHDRPLVINIGPARDAVGGPVQAAIQGQDVKAAADKANAAFQVILDKDK